MELNWNIVMCENNQLCACQRAMKNAYGELRERNLPDTWAFDAAIRIYQHHHPEASRDMALEASALLLG